MQSNYLYQGNIGKYYSKTLTFFSVKYGQSLGLTETSLDVITGEISPPSPLQVENQIPLGFPRE